MKKKTTHLKKLIFISSALVMASSFGRSGSLTFSELEKNYNKLKADEFYTKYKYDLQKANFKVEAVQNEIDYKKAANLLEGTKTLFYRNNYRQWRMVDQIQNKYPSLAKADIEALKSDIRSLENHIKSNEGIPSWLSVQSLAKLSRAYKALNEEGEIQYNKAEMYASLAKSLYEGERAEKMQLSGQLDDSLSVLKNSKSTLEESSQEGSSSWVGFFWTAVVAGLALAYMKSRKKIAQLSESNQEIKKKASQKISTLRKKTVSDTAEKIKTSVFKVNAEGKITSLNSAARKTFGGIVSEGDSWNEFFGNSFFTNGCYQKTKGFFRSHLDPRFVFYTNTQMDKKTQDRVIEIMAMNVNNFDDAVELSRKAVVKTDVITIVDKVFGEHLSLGNTGLPLDIFSKVKVAAGADFIYLSEDETKVIVNQLFQVMSNVLKYKSSASLKSISFERVEKEFVGKVIFENCKLSAKEIKDSIFKNGVGSSYEFDFNFKNVTGAGETFFEVGLNLHDLSQYDSSFETFTYNREANA